MFLNRKDEGGLRLFRCLQQKGVQQLVLVAAEELVFAPAFSCGIQNGKAFFKIALPNGLVLHDGNVTAVMNRIQYLPLQHLTQFVQADRAYVESELLATFTFFFSILPHPVFNQPSGQGLQGRYRSQLEWEYLAQQAGLPTTETVYENFVTWPSHPFTLKRDLKLLFFDGQCYDDTQQVPASVMQQCEALGKLSGERILEICLYVNGRTLVFKSASPHPTLQTLPDDFVNQLVNQL